MTNENDPKFLELKSRLQQDPDSLLFARVADGLLERGQVDEAIRICEEGIRKHPYYVTGHMVLGKCYLQKKLFDLAEKEFKRVILFDPKYIAAHKYYGDLMREVGWDNTCEMSYRKILNIDPLDRNAREMLDTLERIKPKETEVVTPGQTVYDEPDSTPAAVEDDKTVVSTPTESINIDDDLFADVDAEVGTGTGAGTQTEGDNDEAFETILEDIFDDSADDDVAASGESAGEHGTIEELNIKISSRPSPKPVDEAPQVEQPEKGADTDASDSLADEALDFTEAEELTLEAEAAEQLKPVGDEEIEPDPLEDFAAEEENIFDTLEQDKSDVFKGMDLPDEEAAAEPDFEATQQIDARAFETGTESAAEQTAPPPPAEESHPKTVTNAETGTFDREKIVTPTLGEIYAAQGQYAKAIQVFELLLKKDPANANYKEKIEFLKSRMEESQDA